MEPITISQCQAFLRRGNKLRIAHSHIKMALYILDRHMHTNSLVWCLLTQNLWPCKSLSNAKQIKKQQQHNTRTKTTTDNKNFAKKKIRSKSIWNNLSGNRTILLITSFTTKLSTKSHLAELLISIFHSTAHLFQSCDTFFELHL